MAVSRRNTRHLHDIRSKRNHIIIQFHVTTGAIASPEQIGLAIVINKTMRVNVTI